MNSGYRVCVIIPVFNHSQFVLSVFKRIEHLNLFCIIVNDGSDNSSTEYLRDTFLNRNNVELIEQFPNCGKGVAVHKGFIRAQELGYTHAIQVDADGQHCIEDIPKLLEVSKNTPLALVTGVPEYDQSVPKARLYGRYVTHFWVWVETLSFDIKDSMCGFRVYPLKSSIKALTRSRENRMEFDTQIMVKMYWLGVRVISVPTKVTYPVDGVSNFRLWHDNARISWMHTKLVVGMLLRSPALLFRKVNRGLNAQKCNGGPS